MEDKKAEMRNYSTYYFGSDCYMLTFNNDLAKMFPDVPEGYELLTAAVEGEEKGSVGTLGIVASKETAKADLVFIPKFLEFCERCSDTEFVMSVITALAKAGVSMDIVFYLKGTFDGVRQVRRMEEMKKKEEERLFWEATNNAMKKEEVSPETGDDISAE